MESFAVIFCLINFVLFLLFHSSEDAEWNLSFPVQQCKHVSHWGKVEKGNLMNFYCFFSPINSPPLMTKFFFGTRQLFLKTHPLYPSMKIFFSIFLNLPWFIGRNSSERLLWTQWLQWIKSVGSARQETIKPAPHVTTGQCLQTFQSCEREQCEYWQ